MLEKLDGGQDLKRKKKVVKEKKILILIDKTLFIQLEVYKY